MVVYGVEGTHNDVPSAVFDRPFVISGGSLFMEINLDMNNQILRNLHTPTNGMDAATKKYVDKEVKSGKTMTGDINMNANKITNVAYPTLGTDVTTKQYVDISGIFSILNSATATYIDGYIKQNAELGPVCHFDSHLDQFVILTFFGPVSHFDSFGVVTLLDLFVLVCHFDLF